MQTEQSKERSRRLQVKARTEEKTILYLIKGNTKGVRKRKREEGERERYLMLHEAAGYIVS